MREVAAVVSGMCRTHLADQSEYKHDYSGMKLTKAYSFLGDVQEHKQCVPFRRFNGGVGRASQAKQFKATQGHIHPSGIFLCFVLIHFIVDRSLARKVGQVLATSTEKCRVERRR